ncbi:response regulator, partial [Roseomonas sp. 18066]|uniref:hybrid sensor histidine kinase/response regulator n=1 Tax=Roseomonas sp. 18066 TaxID=2681412 RepID=UPI00135B317D
QASAAQLTQALASGLAEQISGAIEAAGLVLTEQRSRIAGGHAPQLSPEMGSLLRDMPQLRALLLTDQRGRVVSASVPMLVGRELGGQPWFQGLDPQAAEGPARDMPGIDFFLLPPQPGRYLDGRGHADPWQRWTLPMALPLIAPETGFAGAAIALLNPDYLTAIAARPAQAFGFAIRLYDFEGRLVARADGGSQGIGQALADNWLFRDFLPRQELGSFSGRDARGREVTASFAVSRQAPVVVEVAQERADVLGAAREQDRILLGAGAAVLAIAGAALWRLLRQGQRLEASEAMAQGASRAKADFLATMSHEIRTPMNGVIGLSGLLLETELGAVQRRYAETIQSSAGHLMAVLNDILDFSKLEAGELEREAVEFSPEKQLGGLLALLAPRAAARGVALLGEVAPGLPPRVAGDLLRFRQILLNLMDNAGKFTEAGWIRVVLSAAPEPGEQQAGENQAGEHGWRLCGTVSDTGIGLDPAKVPMLFERFTQADASTSRRYGGTGLGLAITRRLTELLGGGIEAWPRPGGGSVFRFEILVSAAAHPAPARPPGPLQDLAVLVVEAATPEREVLVAQLRQLGCQPRVADSAALVPAAPDAALVLAAGAEAEALAARPQPPRLVQLQSPGAAAVAQPGAAVVTQPAARFAAAIARPVLPSALRLALLQALDRPAEAAAGGVDAAAPSPAAGRAVLLVEDNAVNQLVLLHMLERAGLAVTAVANGAEAVASAADRRFDIILMDMQMPVMDGLDATRAIRAGDGPNKATRIIGLTAAVGPLYERQCREAGMDDYLTKPVDKALLLAALAG